MGENSKQINNYHQLIKNKNREIVHLEDDVYALRKRLEHLKSDSQTHDRNKNRFLSSLEREHNSLNQLSSFTKVKMAESYKMDMGRTLESGKKDQALQTIDNIRQKIEQKIEETENKIKEKQTRILNCEEAIYSYRLAITRLLED